MPAVPGPPHWSAAFLPTLPPMPTFLDLAIRFRSPAAERRILLSAEGTAQDLEDAVLDLVGAPEELPEDPTLTGLAGADDAALGQRLAERGAKATFRCANLEAEIGLEGWMELDEPKLERRLLAGEGVLSDHSGCGHHGFDLEHEKHHFDQPPPQPPAGEPVAAILKEGVATFDHEVSATMERGRGIYRGLTECCDLCAAKLPEARAAQREGFRAACRIAAHSACRDGLVDARGIEAWAGGIVRVVAVANGWEELTPALVAKQLGSVPARVEASFSTLAHDWQVEAGNPWFTLPRA